jgi:hypothetical protein
MLGVLVHVLQVRPQQAEQAEFRHIVVTSQNNVPAVLAAAVV